MHRLTLVEDGRFQSMYMTSALAGIGTMWGGRYEQDGDTLTLMPNMWSLNDEPAPQTFRVHVEAREIRLVPFPTNSKRYGERYAATFVGPVHSSNGDRGGDAPTGRYEAVESEAVLHYVTLFDDGRFNHAHGLTPIVSHGTFWGGTYRQEGDRLILTPDTIPAQTFRVEVAGTDTRLVPEASNLPRYRATFVGPLPSRDQGRWHFRRDGGGK